MSASNVKRRLEWQAKNEGAIDFAANGIKADVIAESTSGSGVTIDGLLIKDGAIGATAATITGALTLGGGIILDTGTLAASGSTQANAIANAAITKTFTRVTACDNAKGVALPTASAGQLRIVKASVAGSTVQVYPQAGGTINALSENAAYNTAAAGAVAFLGFNTTLWYTIPLAG